VQVKSSSGGTWWYDRAALCVVDSGIAGVIQGVSVLLVSFIVVFPVFIFFCFCRTAFPSKAFSTEPWPTAGIPKTLM
jgi:hypothetical protein